MFAIVLEVQLGEDQDKKSVWPVYVTVTRARRKGCPACVLVVAPDATVAEWAARPIALGLPGDTVQPRVLGPPELPWTDPVEVTRQPEIAVLSAMAHGNEPHGLRVVMAVLAGLALGEEERARIDECDDAAVLDRWLDNAFEAKTAADLFQ